MIEEYYRRVEEVLSMFPKESRKNYYENKKTLKIEKMEVDVPNISGTYDTEENIIKLKKEEAFPHELFHMAFRDKEKVEQEMVEVNDFVYENGIAYRYITDDGKIIIRGKGLVEGFAEYLSRKCTPNVGHQFLYFFADLFISIYGEDILNYPLQNDVVGFFEDERFHEVFDVVKALDNIEDYVKLLKRIVHDKSIIEEYMEVASHEEKIKLSKAILGSRIGFQKSIVYAYEVIITEFENAIEPKVSREEFATKLEEFFNNFDYSMVLNFDNKDFSLTDEIKLIISNFKECKIK